MVKEKNSLKQGNVLGPEGIVVDDPSVLLAAVHGFVRSSGPICVLALWRTIVEMGRLSSNRLRVGDPGHVLSSTEESCTWHENAGLAESNKEVDQRDPDTVVHASYSVVDVRRSLGTDA
jgi:hypothetical protein